jgi:iron complex outermembrane receptor protein
MGYFDRYGFLAGVALGTMQGGTAYAQSADGHPGAASQQEGGGQVEDIIVTARRVSERLQDTPISITALSSNTLESRRVVTLEQIANLAPNVAIRQSFGLVGAINPFIRGIGQSEVQYGQDSPIGIYIDGVYSGRTNNARFDLVELERIEVLRGPQGTLFGRNTTGGALNIVTREPTDAFGAEVKGSYGNYGNLAGRVRVDTGALIPGVKATIAYQHRQNDGYADNPLVADRRDYGASKSDAVWAKLVGEWGRLSVSVSGDYSDLRAYPMLQQGVAMGAGLANFVAVSPTTTGEIYSVSPGYLSRTSVDAPAVLQRIKTRGIGITATYDISDALTAKTITAWRGFTFDGGALAGANAPTGLTTSGVQTIPSFYTITGRSQEQGQFSQEVQLLGNIGDVKFVLGGFYFQERASDFNTSVVAVPRATAIPSVLLSTTVTDYDISNKSYAGFGQATWNPDFADGRLELTGGVRYTKDRKAIVQRGSNPRTGHITPDNVSWLASVSYKWTPAIMTYARYATSYRAGGFNTRATGTTPFVYLPETTKSYEAGFKADLFDRHVRLNGAVYQTDSTDLQVVQFGALTSQQLNAAARYRGFELEATVTPVEGLTLTGSVGHVDPHFKQLFLPNASGVLTNYASIAQFNYVPHWTGNAGLEYRVPPSSYGEWSIRLDYAYVSNVHFVPTNLPNINPFADAVAADAYGIFNGRINLSEIPLGKSSAQVSLYGENIFDKHYRVAGVEYGPSIGFGAVSFGRPATYGIELKADF